MHTKEQRMASLGELERAVMETLWDAAEPLSAYDVRDRLERGNARKLAPTTILTVLSRLEKKQIVTSDRSDRPFLYVPIASRADHMAELMHEALSESPDRMAVLERFIGTVSVEDANALRSLLTGPR